MQIRQAIPSDFPSLMRFYHFMCDILGQRDFLPDGNKGGFPSEEMVRDAISRGFQLIGIVDGDIAAAILLNHDCDPAYARGSWTVDALPEDVMILHALRVHPDYGGQGYSRKMVEFSIDFARKRGIKALRLDCIVGNDIPVKMYQSYGFQYAGTVDITYEDIGKPMPFRLYELAL